MQPTTRRFVAVFLSLVLAGTLAYSNSFDNSFQFDDAIWIGQLTMEPNSGPEGDSWTVNQATVYPSRFITRWTFALNHRLHGLEVRGYHIVNLAIHIVNAFLVFLFIRSVLGLPRAQLSPWLPRSADAFAWIASLAWLVHPIHTSVVNYTWQRATSLSTTFSLLALLSFLWSTRAATAGSRGARLGLAFSALVLAIGAKQVAILVPLSLLLLVWTLGLPSLARYSSRTAIAGFALAYLLLIVATGWQSFGWSGFTQAFSHIAGGTMTDGLGRPEAYTMAQRLASQPRVLLQYLAILAFPHPAMLSFDRDPGFSTGPFDPWTTMPAILLIVGLCLLGLIFRRQRPLLSFAILFFFLNHALEAGPLHLELMYEHRNYLPSVGFVLGTLLAANHLLERFSVGARGRLALALAVTALLGTATLQRNTVWRDHLSFWSDAVAKSPNKGRTHANLAAALAEQGQQLYPEDMAGARAAYEEALRHIQRAVALDPETVTNHLALGNAHLALGQAREAIRAYDTARPLTQDTEMLQVLDLMSAQAYETLAQRSGSRRDRERALEHYERLARSDPSNVWAHQGIATNAEQLGDTSRALGAYVRVLELDPADVHAQQAVARLRSGR